MNSFRRIFCILLFFSSLSFETNAQWQTFPQFQSGVYIDSFVGSFSCYIPDSCYSNWPVIYVLTNKLPVEIVDGVKINLIVSSISPPPDSIYYYGGPKLKLGDTLSFDTAAYCLLAFSGPGGININVRVNGTPTLTGQEYPCSYALFQTNGTCPLDLWMDEYPSSCYVDYQTGIGDYDWSSRVYFSNGSIFIEKNNLGGMKSSSFELFDMQGREVKKLLNSGQVGVERFVVGDLRHGTYCWKLVNESGEFSSGKVFVSSD